MAIQRRASAISALALLACGAGAWAEGERGVFGVTVAITADGLLNPTVRSAKITHVRRDLPAHRAGVSPGDEVLELDGKRIPGASATDLAPLAKGKRVGERLTITLQRPDGKSYSAVLVAEQPSR